MRKTGTDVRPHSGGYFWLMLLKDVFVAALILGLFCFFLRTLPQTLKHEKMEEASGGTFTVTEAEDQTAEVSFGDTADDAAKAGATSEDRGQAAVIISAESSDSGSPEAEAAADRPFREKFADFFTEEAVFGKKTYTSPDISIQITQVTDDTHGSLVFRAYIADFYVSSVESFQAGFPQGQQTAEADRIAADHHAVLAVNGDYYTNISRGLVVRNGVVMQSEKGTADLCVLYPDGRMKTYEPGDYSPEGILNQNPWQVWSFGPALLEEDGSPKTDFNTSSAVYNRNPRTAFGYYEPGHYCLVVIDGRNEGYSNGASIRALASFMSDLGYKAAYNLDGGASSVMVFNGEIINNPSGGGRKLCDMVMLCEPPTAGIIDAGG